MAFTELSGDFAHVRALPDQPRLEDGFTPLDVKNAFDRAGQEIKAYLNQTHLAELASASAGASGAESIGSAPAEGLAAGSVHAQICTLKTLCDNLEDDLADAVNGIIPDGTVGFSKWDTDTQALLSAVASQNLRINAFTTPGAGEYTVPKTGTYRLRLCGGGGGGSYRNETLRNAAPAAGESYPCLGGPSGAGIETYLDLESGTVIPYTVGGGAIPQTANLPFHISQSFSLDDYQLFLQNRSWETAGSASSFGNAQLGFSFACSGGFNRVEGHIGTAFTNAQYPVIVCEGEKHVLRTVIDESGVVTTSLSQFGAPSLFGRGAGRANSQYHATLGGGGCGGTLTAPDAETLTVAVVPTAGAGGFILLEYVG